MSQSAALVFTLWIACATPLLPVLAQGRGTAPPKPTPNGKIVPLPGFSVEIPKRNWEQLPVGIGSSLVVFLEKSKEATVAVEIGKGEVPLDDKEIVAQTAALEIDDWKPRRPLATGFTYKIEPAAGGKVIIIDLIQPGAKGLERVRLYTLPRGTQWFRVICTAPQASFPTYEATFKTIAMSLTPNPSK